MEETFSGKQMPTHSGCRSAPRASTHVALKHMERPSTWYTQSLSDAHETPSVQTAAPARTRPSQRPTRTRSQPPCTHSNLSRRRWHHHINIHDRALPQHTRAYARARFNACLARATNARAGGGAGTHASP